VPLLVFEGNLSVPLTAAAKLPPFHPSKVGRESPSLANRLTIRSFTFMLALLSGCFEDPEPGVGTAGASSGAETGDSGNTQGESDPTTDPTTNPTDPTAGGCMGCLDAAGGCLAGDQDNACGALAVACEVCDAEDYCAEGTCTPRPLCTPDNCNGCCDGDDCIESPDDAACGRGGQMCTECTGDSTCNEGFCELPCEDTCDGCCDATGDCVPFDALTDQACGIQGEVCSSCQADFTCEGGSCISNECAMNCAGCCDGADCFDGAADSACGSGGAACEQCPQGTECGGDGFCTPAEGTLWDLEVASGDLPPADPNGNNWDQFGGAPDPFFRITLQDGTSEQTSVVSNNTIATWNERLVLNASAEQLMMASEFAIYDDDAIGSELAGSCQLAIPADLFGVQLQFRCFDPDSDPDSDPPLYTLVFSVVLSEM